MISKKKMLVAISSAALIGLLFLSIYIRNAYNSAPAVSLSPTLSPDKFPLYKNYQFSKEPNVIDIGIQPLWLPAGIISEVMSRDRILRQSLHEQGKEIHFHQFLKGADVNFFLGRGDLEVGIGGDMPAIVAVSHHKARVASRIQQGFCSIVARKYMQIKDLKNKKIGIPYASNAHYGLMTSLAGVGLTIQDIRPVYMDITNLPSALHNKEIDAYTAWEPTPAVSLKTYPDQVIIHRFLSTGYLYFSNSFNKVINNEEALEIKRTNYEGNVQ